MAKPFEVYKKPHDYVNDFYKEWSPISKQYKKRTPEYFDEVRKFKKYWGERLEATEKKANLIIYGFEEKPKRSHHERDRSDLYLKIVKRNPEYKNWVNLGIALVSVTLFMQVIGLFNYFFTSYQAFSMRISSWYSHSYLISHLESIGFLLLTLKSSL